MPDRLDYIKQKLEEQKKSPAVILRHSDGEWAASEIERLRAENERLIKEFKDLDIFVNLCDADERAIQPYEIGDRISFALEGGVNNESSSSL